MNHALHRGLGAVLALLAVVAMGLLLLPGGLLHAQDSGPIEYAENGTDPVATFTATDPEGETISWSLATGNDMDDFMIENGVLRFVNSPDYETPTDADTNNEYTVTVQAMAGTSADAVISTVTEEVTVMVTNVDEPGSIMLSTLQPQADIAITATLSDADTRAADGTTVTIVPTWQWYRGSTEIPGATAATFTPSDRDVGFLLRVEASYDDGEGEDKTAEQTSAHAVRAAPATNVPPAFPDTDTATTGVQQTREVAENTPAGEDIGDAVVATDPGDILTYSLGGADAALFSLDRATGQLRTKGALDFDTSTGGQASRTVTVTATDPFGAAGEVTVTVTVTNVNEAPPIPAAAASTHSFEENTTALTVGAAYTAADPEGLAVDWSVSGPDSGKFTIPAGQLTFSASPDFEAAADADGNNVYEVTVVASDPAGNSDELDVRVTVTNVAEDGSISFSSLRPKTGIALTASLSDPDGGVTDVKWQWNDGTDDIEDATTDTYTPVVGDIGDTLSVTATYKDAESGTTERTVTQPIGNAVVADTDNKAPVFPDQDAETDGRQTDQERTVAELTDARVATPAGTDIGDPVAAETDNTKTSDGTDVADVLTYTLGGTDAASFDIVRASGQLQTKAALDYETKQSYSVTVTATDPGNLSATVNVTIKVMNVNEDPVLTGEAPAEYAENGTAAVTTFSATDPEGEDIVWTLTGDDMEDFTIVGGVLRFASSPNFEAAADDNTDNTYEVTVNASDGTNSSTEEVTIAVTNVEEAGTVTLSTLQPQVGVEIDAELTDPDAGGTTASPTWSWLRGSTVIEGATTAAYTPVQADAGSFLTAKATYRDAEDADNDKTAEGRSYRAARSAPSGTSAPVFPDTDLSTTGVQTAQTRMVAENTPAGRNIGAPVVASDPGDVLTYSLTGTNADQFELDRVTGQLRTKGALNREAIGSPFTQVVTVTATDPGELTAESIVTITVTNVDEAPALGANPTRDISSLEGTTAAPLTLTTPLATYTATEPESETMTWSLSGADAAIFNIGNQGGATPGELTFKAQPDFENPADADQGNVYEVTVVVSDPAGNSDEVDVRVTVTNVAELGEITFSTLQPKVGIALTATLNDADGSITGLMWQWYDAAFDAANPETNAIEDATSATYIPVSGDIGDTLTAVATYRDGSLAASADAITLSQAHTATVVADTDNKAPVFPDQDTATEGRQTDQERTVAENTASGTAIQAADIADFTPTDNTLAPDGTASADTLTYSLGGTDMASFSIDRATGQISTKAALDHEDKDTYVVTLTATDPGNLSTTVNVTIKVTDMDEAPDIMLGGLAISGDRSVEVEEGSTAVATYSAAGPNADMAVWSVSGDDAGAFSISGGELTFASAPDFEAPTDADGDNMYVVTVEADDGTYSDTREVTVTVTNMEEAGTLTLSSSRPVVNVELTAMLADPDEVTPGTETWQWASENPDGTYTDIDGATSASYTPVAEDDGKHLRVTVEYTDGYDSGNREMKISDNVVTAGDPLVVRYDANSNGVVDRDEVIKAINDYLFEEGDDPPSKDDVIKLIELYLFPS